MSRATGVFACFGGLVDFFYFYFYFYVGHHGRQATGLRRRALELFCRRSGHGDGHDDPPGG